MRCVTAALLMLAFGGAAPASAAPMPPVPDTQDGSTVAPMIGAPATARPVAPRTRFLPVLAPKASMHGDGGNSDTTDFPGPLGAGSRVGSAAANFGAILLFDAAGRVTISCAVPDPQRRLKPCLAAADAQTLSPQAVWLPPVGQTAMPAYMYMDATNRIIIPSVERHINLVQRIDGPLGPSFSTVRSIDLNGVITADQPLLNAMLDASGNIWFSTGGIRGVFDGTGTATTVGYVSPEGAVRSVRLPDGIVENGGAVDKDTFYLVTGPPAGETARATGGVYAFRADRRTGEIKLSWQESYDAGSTTKPGGFSRGSGTTPTLVGDRYLALTDNADGQVNLLVYDRSDDAPPSGRLACKMPLFSSGASAVEVSPIGHQDGDNYSVVVQNAYGEPPLTLTPVPIDGAHNDMSAQAPGMQRIDIGPDGECRLAWSNDDIRIKSVPFLSTATGLVYGYTQDAEQARRGNYVWQFFALDFRSGELVWLIRAGAGGAKNDMYLAAALGPDGTLYQGVTGGVLMLRDATSP